jgi:ATP-dependent helicase/nuclease subunit B
VGTSQDRLRRLVTGDYPDLEAALVDEVARLRAHDRLSPLIVLVSSHLLGVHLKRLLAVRGKAHMNLRFLTLENLAAAVATPDLAAKGKAQVPSFASEMIMSTAAAQLASSGKRFYFRGIADRPGFHQAALATIEDLKKACLSPGDLEARARLPGVRRSINEAKVGDLLRMWKLYEDRLRDLNWFDECDLIEEAARLIPESAVIQQASGVIVYGFYDFNTVQQHLLESCIESRETAFLVPYRPEPAFKYAEPAIAWLRSNGFEEVGLPGGGTDGSATPRTRAPAVEHLCNHLFGGGQPAVNPEEAITILSAPGERREVRETIREVVARARQDGIPLHEVGILLRSPEPYEGIFREALDGLGFKAYMPGGTPLSGTRSGRSVLLMLDILGHDFARRKVMEFTTYANLRTARSSDRDETRAMTSLWDVISMDAGVVGGTDEWLNRLRRHCDDLERERKDPESPGRRPSQEKVEAARSLCRFIERLVALLAEVLNGQTWTDKTDALVDAFSSLVEDDEHTGEVRLALEQLRCLDELGTPPSDEAFCGFAEEALAASTGPAGRFQRNGPAVLNLMAARGIPFTMVVIPGMVEKSFPPVVRQDAILLDDERAALNEALSATDSRPLRLKARERLDEERLLFRLAVGAAREKLLVTYPRIEIPTARERLPSSLLMAAVKALSGRQVDFEAIERFGGFNRVPLARLATDTPDQALDRLEYDLAQALREIADRKPRHLHLLRETCRPFDLAIRLEAERWGRKVFTRYDGVLSRTEAGPRGPDVQSVTQKAISPTRLETYATCPYRYLLDTVMGIEPLVEPERTERISPLDRGRLIHDILWEFLTELERDRGLPVTVRPEDRDRLHEISSRRFREFEQHGNTGYPALWMIDKDTILRYFDRFVEEEAGGSDYLPAYFEVRYGMKPYDANESAVSTDTPVPLSVGRRDLSIRGKIDRIDITPDGKHGRVVDYKSGKAYGRPNDLSGGSNLQLPLYMIAAEWILKDLHRGIRMEESEYYHVTQDTKRHVGFDRETLESGKKDLADILDTIVDSIDSGLFFAYPGDYCRSCDFLFICGAYRHTLFDMKSGDPAVRDFMKMKEIGRE